MGKLNILVFLFILIVFLYLTISLLLFDPPIWPDEAYIVDSAISLLNKGQISTELFGPLIPGSTEKILWYPPVLFILLSGWIKVFGVSIIHERLLSLTAASFFLLIYYLLSKSITKSVLFSFVPLILLILDNNFLKTSKIIRPEIFVLLFSSFSLYLSLKINQINLSSPVKNLLALSAGIVLSFAFLTHFMAIIFVIPVFLLIFYQQRFNLLKSKIIQLFSLGFFIPLLLYFVSIIPNFSLFLEQISLQNQFRLSFKSSILTAFCCGSLETKITFFTYFSTATIFLLYSIFQKKALYLNLSFIQILSLFYMIVGKLEWYTVMIVPFTLLSLTILIKNLNNHFIIFIIITLITILTLSNIKIYFQNLNFYNNGDYVYDKFKEEILAIIPDHSAVFISTIPDAYFVFKPNRSNVLFQFVSMPEERKDLEFVLNKSDYIILNQTLGDPRLLDFFIKYVELNESEAFNIGSKNQYQAIIIKLKPPLKRQIPK